jgi:transketolase
VLIASGSEVDLALRAAKVLAADKTVRVVSMPSWDLFERQPEEYRQSVFPPACKTRVAIEAGVSMGWEKYVGDHGAIISINRFGASAPYADLARNFGFTVENVVATVNKLLGR